MKTGKVTSAGMFFLHFQVYRLDPTINAVSLHSCSWFVHITIYDDFSLIGIIHSMSNSVGSGSFSMFSSGKGYTENANFLVILQLLLAKDPDAAFFKRLEGLQPCEMSALKEGTHIFAVYGQAHAPTVQFLVEGYHFFYIAAMIPQVITSSKVHPTQLKPYVRMRSRTPLKS